MATDSHGNQTDFVPTGPTHDQSYEPDKFAVKTILAVPIAVIGTAFLAFVTTSLLFDNIFDPGIKETSNIPSAVVRGDAPLNDKFARTSSTDPNAENNQPRLEGLNRTQIYYRDGDPTNKDPNNVITSEITPTKPLQEGNSPRYRAGDLAADKVDATRKGAADGMPIDKAMAELVTAGLLKAKAGAATLEVNPDWDRPKESNGGRNTKAGEAAPAPVEVKKKDPEPEKKKEPEPEKRKDPEPGKKNGDGKKE